MNNREFKVGDHIVVYGNKGIVEEITYCKECKYDFEGDMPSTGCFTDETINRMISKGYTVVPTGRTATYFKVFFTDECLSNTAYNHGDYGCLDEFENYGTW